MIPSPVYDDETGALIPIPWERVQPGGVVDVVETNPEDEASDLAYFAADISAAMKLGVMPLSGGLLEQPAKALLASRLWDTACHAIEKRMNIKRGAA